MPAPQKAQQAQHFSKCPMRPGGEMASGGSMGTPLRATCRPEQGKRPHLAIVGKPLRAEELQPDPQEEGLDESRHHWPLHN